MDGTKCILMIFFSLVVSLHSKKLWKEEDMNIGYDFENVNDLENIEHGKGDTKITESVRKHGNRSLEWNWKVDDYLLINLSSQIAKHKNTYRLCGLHFWIYQEIPVDTHLRVTYYNDKGEELSFRVDLSFKSWRAVARKVAITKLRELKGLTRVKFSVENNDPRVSSGKIIFDLIRVSFRCVGWTYDFINPPQIALEYNQRNEIGGIEDLNGIYEINHHWQNMYKWGKIDQHFQEKIDHKTKLSRDENKWTKQLKKIQERVENWYFPRDKSNFTLFPIARAKLTSLFNCNITMRVNERFMLWMESLVSGNFAYLRKKKFSSRDTDPDICVNKAYRRLAQLSDHGKWPSLFPSRDVLPHGRNDWTGLKFHEINTRILFPLTLEYFISTRRIQRKHSNAAGFKSPMTVLQQELKNEPKLLKAINSKNFKTIKKAYKMIDNKRLGTIKDLLSYLQREGWDDGSGLGNTDHLINQNWGFTHSLFLLKNVLGDEKNHLLNAARWYNEIGEIHQKQYQHTGATADKLRNVMISRLLIILASPMGSIKEARQKLLDAERLKKWIENALEINQGYGGLIKPDFTGYHHKGPYMSAYTTHALHALSLVAYFLHGTHFQISRKHLNNLKEALNTFYVISNSRAVPHSVSGAKVSYNNIKLNHVLPAYAYLSIALQRSPTHLDKDMARIFLKLYKKNDPYLLINLLNGKINDDSTSCSCQYLNSIGSIDVFEKVQKLAILNGYTKAESPNGHWSKNFASISIHRRKEWVVTIKGFSKYIWDYESTVDQNLFGRYQSHGQMLIANGRASLSAYDIFSGYDWNRVPGTTTVELELDQLRSQEKCRYFSKSTTVGGLQFGKKKKKNGIYVMDFDQPQYLDTFFKENRYSFKFKKSFFFFNDYIVCLGSNIHKSGLLNKNVITTLFQNKLTGPASIQMNELIYDRSNKNNFYIDQKEPITFLDVNNNGYYVPAKTGHRINMKIGKQNDARQPNGKKVKQPKTYASVAFVHGTTPTSDSYEYVVLVDSGPAKLKEFSKTVGNNVDDNKPYMVIRQDDVAHVVRFTTESSITYTGYTIFNSSKFVGDINNDIIRTVNRPCVVMVKRTPRYVTISVMDPDLRMFDDYILTSRSIQKNFLFNSSSRRAWLRMSFNRNLKMINRKNPDKRLRNSIGKHVTGYRSHIRLLLSHGLTSEIKFRVLKKK